jgi:hypothetical protein
MMWIRNQNGSALLLVLLIVVIFSVLGLSLISSTVNGSIRNEVREADTLATYQAEKGLEHFQNHLEKYLASVKEIPDLTPEMAKDAINQFINEYNTEEQFIQSQGLASVRITNTTQLDPFTYQIDVLSTGIDSNRNKEKEVTYTYTIQIINAPDQLKYAVGSTGDMFLHGSVSIIGDMHVSRHLFTTDHGWYPHPVSSYYQLVWKNSDLPTVQGKDSGVIPILTLGGKIYKITQLGRDYIVQDVSRYYSHTGLDNNTSFNYDSYSSRYNQVSSDDIQLAFKDQFAPAVVAKDVTFSSINIDSFKEKYLLRTGGSPIIDGEHINVTNANDTEFTGDYSNFNIRSTRNEDLTLYDVSFGRFSSLDRNGGHTRTLTITGDELVDFGDGAFYDGDVVIQGSPKIKGPLFVTGALYISNANVQFDSTIYVQGRTSISNSTIRGMAALDPGGNTYYTSLVLLGKQSIDTQLTNTNLSFPITEENKIRAFLYSEDHIHMFGIISNLQIEGGIFAKKNVIFNAVKGNTYDTYRDGQVKFPTTVSNSQAWWFSPNQTSLAPEQSRIRIEYNHDLINHPPMGLPPSIKFELKNKR